MTKMRYFSRSFVVVLCKVIDNPENQNNSCKKGQNIENLVFNNVNSKGKNYI